MIEGRSLLNGDRLDQTGYAEGINQVAGGVDARIADGEGPAARPERLDGADPHDPDHEGDGQEQDEPRCHSSRPSASPRSRRGRPIWRRLGWPNDGVHVATLLHRLP